jgi:TPP-dependent pyruvate/acetoin dehydrogenase alpha subunit
MTWTSVTTAWFKSYFSFSSGGLGWGAPAAVGIAFAQKKNGKARPVVAFLGDGSLQYSIQCMYSAAQHKLKVVFIVPWNDEYATSRSDGAREVDPLAYRELHRLAQHCMRGESPGGTLQATALVNEAYVRLIDTDRMRRQKFVVASPRGVAHDSVRVANY